MCAAWLFFPAWLTAQTFHLTEDESVFPNPERGFYIQRDMDAIDAAEIARVRDERAMTLVLGKIPLSAYRTRSRLPSSFLTRLQTGFDRVRAAGAKVIVRADYGFAGPGGDYTTYEDPRLEIIEGHIGQLAPLFAANADLIALFQAGFIGPWGEWHTTALSRDVARRRSLLFHLLDNTPAERMVVIRYPALKQSLFETLLPLDATAAHSGSRFARVGHHNDCFLSSADDVGTYNQGAMTMAGELAYLHAETRHTPFGGESCGLHERSESEAALFELEYLHATYLNSGYHPDVLDRWEGNGVMAVAERRLGARLVATAFELPSAAYPGQAITVRLAIANRGFASLYNARPASLVLIAPDGARHRFPLGDADPRRWQAGETVGLRADIVLPTALSAGPHAWALHLPDASARLAADARYAWRLANLDAWDASTGENRLVVDWPVAPAYPATYAEWVAQAHPGHATDWADPGSPARPEAMSPGEAVTNLHRFAFGPAPGESMTFNPLRLSAPAGEGGGVLAFRLPAPAPSGLRYALQESDDLERWSDLDWPAPAAAPVRSGMYLYNEYNYSIPDYDFALKSESEARRFYRLRAGLIAEE